MNNESLKIDPKEIFICYRGANDKAIGVGMELYYLLEKLGGVSCFFAPRVIPTGADYKTPLAEYFESVKVVVLLLTPGFFNACANPDDVVLDELNIAFENRRMKFLPIIFDGFLESDYEEALKYFDAKDVNRFKTIDAYQYHGPYDDTIEKAVEAIIKLKDTPIEKDIHDELSVFKENETKREYDLRITNDLAVKYINDPNSEDALLGLIENVKKDEEYISYNAYYCLNVMYRRTKDYEKLGELITRYHGKFTSHPSASHLLVLYYLETGYTDNYEKMLSLARKDALIFTDNAGFIHSFPYVVASLYEEDVPDDKEKYLSCWYDSAMDAVNAAIELSPEYAKYYCTKARLLAMNGHYKEAEQFVNRAISLEDSRRSDYFIRILDYQYYKIMIKTDEKLYEMAQKRSKEEAYV